MGDKGEEGVKNLKKWMQDDIIWTVSWFQRPSIYKQTLFFWLKSIDFSRIHCLKALESIISKYLNKY